MENHETKELWGGILGHAELHGTCEALARVVFFGGGGVGKKAYYCNSLMSPERKLNSPFKDEVTALQSLRNHGVTFPVCRDLFYFVFFGLTRTGKETSAMA